MKLPRNNCHICANYRKNRKNFFTAEDAEDVEGSPMFLFFLSVLCGEMILYFGCGQSPRYDGYRGYVLSKISGIM